MCWVWGTLGSCPPGQTDDLVDRVREHGNQQNPIDTDAQVSCIPAVWGLSAGVHGREGSGASSPASATFSPASSPLDSSVDSWKEAGRASPP